MYRFLAPDRLLISRAHRIPPVAAPIAAGITCPSYAYLSCNENKGQERSKMKRYMASNQLRLVGKGWEIRHHLRKLAAAEDGMILSRFTKELPPMKVSLGSSRRP
ncbi:Z-ring formation inhibitor MciZ [Paenibacillus pinisoli]|uniref:Z-ring formation inhibitor MciZ n=2 Tax=Paenibacillus pinisoli TaxID=1276110 RepID=A0A3A6PJT7_9BACL|nr:Z-ring formation inhibitor MciZ [Paenibacillus pinisoli]